MKRVLVFAACLALFLCMASAPAIATDETCRQVLAHIEGATYAEAPECYFNGVDYPFCLYAPMTGTLNGTFYFYFPDENYVIVEDPLPGHEGLAAGYGIAQWITNRGEIWSRDSWLVDIAHFGDFAAFTQVSYITGGTGMYEGATGDIFSFGSDLGGSEARGQVCTPK